MYPTFRVQKLHCCCCKAEILITAPDSGSHWVDTGVTCRKFIALQTYLYKCTSIQHCCAARTQENQQTCQPFSPTLICSQCPFNSQLQVNFGCHIPKYSEAFKSWCRHCHTQKKGSATHLKRTHWCGYCTSNKHWWTYFRFTQFDQSSSFLAWYECEVQCIWCNATWLLFWHWLPSTSEMSLYCKVHNTSNSRMSALNTGNEGNLVHILTSDYDELTSGSMIPTPSNGVCHHWDSNNLGLNLEDDNIIIARPCWDDSNNSCNQEVSQSLLWGYCMCLWHQP